MSNLFLEKLKKGMGIEIPGEEKETEEKPEKKKKPVEKKLKKIAIEEEAEENEEEIEETESDEEETEEAEEPMVVEQIENEDAEEEETEAVKKIEIQGKPKLNKKIILKAKKMTPDEINKEEKEDWLVPEGQLSVDVYQTKEELVIQSAIAGIRPDALDISLEGDVVTIKGKREKPNNEEGDYFTQECYWGQFSRDVILPVDVDPNRVKAEMKDGILTIRIPKIFREKKRKILVKKLNE